MRKVGMRAANASLTYRRRSSELRERKCSQRRAITTSSATVGSK